MSNSTVKAGERRTINGLRNPSLACVPRECCGHQQFSCRADADTDIAGFCLFSAHLCVERALPNVFRPRPHTADGGWSAGAKKPFPAHVRQLMPPFHHDPVSCGGGGGGRLGSQQLSTRVGNSATHPLTSCE